jgi:biotin transport system substrate-specific component
MITAAFFAALTTIGAWLSFPLPFSPVPIVLSNLFAVLAGAILGKRLGAISQTVYLVMGVIGIPVFAKFTAGPGILFGATGGYLFGFVAAAFVTGLLVEYLPLPPVTRFAVAMTAGMAVIYLPGIPWLARIAGFDIPTAMVKGLYPYLPGDIAKVIVGTVLCMSLMSQLPRLFKIKSADELTHQAAAD